MKAAYGLVAMRLYVTRDEAKKVVESPAGEEIKTVDIVPGNLIPFLRNGRPSLGGLVEQATDEAAEMGRLGIATCGSRKVNIEVKNAVGKNLRKDMPDMYCHSEDFDY
jgi:hypothetical protein